MSLCGLHRMAGLFFLIHTVPRDHTFCPNLSVNLPNPLICFFPITPMFLVELPLTIFGEGIASLLK